MGIRIVQLGADRNPGEGVRVGTVRPPRGVPKERFSLENWYDVWLPQLAPSADLVKMGQSTASDAEWKAFERKGGLCSFGQVNGS